MIEEIYIGNKCENNCVSCYYRSLKPPKISVIKKEINKIKKNKRGILFVGGDPFLNKNLNKFVDYAHKKKFNIIGLKTNCIKFANVNFSTNRKDLCKLLFKINFIKIEFFATNKKLYNSITSSINFSQSIKGIKNIIKLYKEKYGENIKNRLFLDYEIPVFQKNFKHLNKIIYLIKNLDCNKITLSFLKTDCRFSKILTFVKDVIKLSISYNVWIETKGIPFCLMKDFEKFVGELYNYIDTKFYSKYLCCSKCALRKICPGIPKYYILKYGLEEFKSFRKSKVIDDILKLKNFGR